MISTTREAMLDELERVFAAQPSTRTGIEAVLQACQGRRRTKGIRINLDAAAGRLQEATSRRQTVDAILRATCRHFGCTVGDLREGNHAEWRWVAIWVLRLHKVSYPACARAVGLTNHTSALHGYRMVEADQGLWRVAAAILERARGTAAARERAA